MPRTIKALAFFLICLCMISAIGMFHPRITYAQASFQIELACPAGTSPLPGGTTYNGVTGKFRQNICIDAFGNISQTVTTSTITGAVKSTDAVTGITSCITNNMYVAGSSCYSTINAAVTAAGTTGSVLIPGTYAGTDVITNPNNIPLLDLRGATGADDFRVWSGYSAAYPVTNFPLGNNLRFVTHGPADMHFNVQYKLATTTTASLSVGANTNILLGAFSCVSGGNSCVLPFVGTANMLTPANVGSLLVGRETANAEVITSANWSIVDATHISLTCAKTHTGTTDIEQIGSTFLEGYQYIMNCKALVPANSPANDSGPCRFIDAGSFVELLWPTFNPDNFPQNAFQFGSLITGLNGANKNLVYRNSTTSSQVQWLCNNANTCASLDDNANFAVEPTTTAGTITTFRYFTATNCASSASPSVCSAAAAGSVAIAAGSTTLTVNTTAVGGSSQIILTRDDSLGARLGVTCNTATVMGEMKVSARTAGTSFTITVQTAPVTNPGCLSYSILN